MGAVWLLDIDDWLAEEFDDDEFSLEPGWVTRSRSSGGYNAIYAIGTHHTAGGGSASGQVSHAVNAEDAPIGAIHLYANGHVHVIAAGATNTQGKGGPLVCSRGTVPLNQGNLYMVSIEAHNNGIGGVWPQVQLRNYLRLVALLCRKLGLDPLRDVFGHAGYVAPSCPGRKIDPAGPTPAYPSLGGVSAPPARTWRDADFRRLVADLDDKPDPEPEPPKPPATRVPTPPRQPRLGNVRRGAIEASWTAPTDPGSSDVFQYVVQRELRSKPGDWRQAAVTAGNVLRTDIWATDGEEYRVRVLARNSQGASGWSDVSAWVKAYERPAAPPPPPKHTIMSLPHGMKTSPADTVNRWSDADYPALTRWLQTFFREQGWYGPSFGNWDGVTDGNWESTFQGAVRAVQVAFKGVLYKPASPQPLRYTDGVWWQETATKLDAWMRTQPWFK